MRLDEARNAEQSRLRDRFADYQKAVVRLREALAEPETPITRDATIQRFEFTFELGWKTISHYLHITEQVEALSPKVTLMEAFKRGLIVDANSWTALHQARNQTVHTYDEAQAKQVYDLVKANGLALLDALQIRLTTELADGPEQS